MKGKNSVAAFLAITVMMGFLGIFYLLTFRTIPPENKDFFNMGFIALIGFCSTAFGYYLGSSLGSAQKTSLMAGADDVQKTVPDMPLAAIPPIPRNGSDGFIRTGLLLPMLALAALLLAMTLFYGCATATKGQTPQSIAAKSLLTTRQAIIASATTADSLCSQGYMAPTDCTRASLIYIQAQKAYATASDAFLLYLIAGDATARQDYEKALPPLVNLFTDIDSLVKTVKPVEGGNL